MDVIIEVRDGMAEVLQLPQGVSVIIRDFDVQEETSHQDDEGNYYKESIYNIVLKDKP
ncbi:hypothetical protein LCGC14_0386510 [marine sediment metagenome]|uniref:Uncharacterized protein n=1 Tax=marine sediment metagenome TaxID=412755 RepID=A0A0F9TJ36_9ZZZZ